MRNTAQLVIFGAVLLAGAPFVAAADKHVPAPAPDRIDVIGHLPLSDGPVVHLTLGDHWRRSYLYVDHGSTKPVAILDVTDAAAPKAAGELDIPRQEASGNLSAVVGTAALVASPASVPAPQTVTIMNFADPEHPKMERRFDGVTAMVKDLPRGLVYLVDANGLWVLHMEAAADVDQEEQYRNYVLYYH